MVAVFTGLGAGFQRSSVAQIGPGGLLGSGTQGRGGDTVSVNAATGNLLINRQDEFLVGRGLDVDISRTYNGLSSLSHHDENGDQWRQSTDRRIRGWSSNLNQNGAYLYRVSSDGTDVKYTYSNGAYRTTEGSGSHDTVTYTSGKFTWTDGDTGVQEVYKSVGASGGWRITEQIDPEGNKVSFTYSGGKLSKVTTADGGYLQYTWSGDNITKIKTFYKDPQGVAQDLTRTYYDYDSQNRLIKVTTDLTPENNSTADSNAYWTTYSYIGNSKQVGSIRQIDGSRVDFAYDGSGRVTSIAQTAAAGETRTTNLTYTGAYTQVYDPSGVETRLYHDGNEQLTSIRRFISGDDQITRFTYDADGNVTSVEDAEDGLTSYTYDSRGNVLTVTDALGAVTTNNYDSDNNLTRIRYAGSQHNTTNAWQYTRMVYDTDRNLRYSISPEGHVTEFEYDAYGRHTYTKTYPDQAYAIGGAIPTLTQVNDWVSGLSDKTAINISRNIYSAQGQIARTLNYGTATTAGTQSTAEGFSDLRYTYDSAGRLLSSKSTRDIGSTYTYDGLGRTIRTTDTNGGTTTIVFNDASTQTVITSATGGVTTSTYNKAGDLIHQRQSGSFDLTGTTTYKYDELGRVRVSTDGAGVDNYYVYDDAGNLTATLNDYGHITEYRYDLNGRVIATAKYTNTNRLSAAEKTLLADPHNSLTIGNIRPTAHSYDIWEWTAYDAKGQVTRTALGDGSVTAYTYDKAGRITSTKTYFNKISSSDIAALKAGTKTLETASLPATNSKDVTTRTFYNRDGQVIGTRDGDGYLSVITYDEAGREVASTVYASKPNSNSSVFSTLLANTPKSSSKDATVRSVYDGQGQLRFTIDARGKVTEYVYGTSSSAIGLVRRTIQHTATLPSLSNYKLATVKSAVAALGSTSTNRSTWAVYNTKNQVVYSIDSVGGVTQFKYDLAGRVIKTTQFAAVRTTNSLPTEGTMNSWASNKTADARISRSYYTASGLLRFSIDPEGYVTRYDYDAAGRQTYTRSYANALNPTDSWTISTVNNASKGASVFTRTQYDLAGRVYLVHDANGTRSHYTYYANGEIQWDIRAFGTGRDESRVLYVNDAAGQQKHKFEYSVGTSGARNQTNYSYDGLGNLTEIVETRGTHAYATANQVTKFEYDKSGNVTKQTNAEGGITRFEYNAFGQVTKTTDPRGNVSYNHYNNAGQLTATVDAENYAIQTTYTAFGEVATVTRRYREVASASPLSIHTNGQDTVTTYYYDKRGQVTRVKDALGKSDYYVYDAFGQQIETTNKLGGKTYSTYDKRGQMTQSRVIANVYNHVGTRVATEIINKYEYDSRGNQTKMIEAFGRTEARTTTYVYDAANQLIQKKGDAVTVYTSGTDSSAATVTPTEYYTYDRRGNLIESKDANGARTLYYYDRLDRLTHQISPEGTLVRNFYDANSNLMETRVYGNKVALPGNALGTPPAGSGAYRRTTFAYDRLNRLTDSYVHNVQTAQLQSTFTVTRTDNVLHTEYVYDANGNVTKVIDPNGGQTTSAYDKLGRKTSQVDAGGFTTSWAYNAYGNVTREIRYGTGSDASRITDFTYDKNGNRLTEKRLSVKVFNGSSGETTADSTIRYLYNALGQVTRKTEATGEYIDYTYDAQGRLNYETRSAFTDHLGNSVRAKVQYLYNGLNDVSRVYKYGATGTAASDSHYIYAKGGRLTSVTDGNGFVRTYRYDAKGQLVREEYVRATATQGNKTEGIGYEFDKEGRVTAQGAVWKSGSTWTRSGLDVIQSKYNAFGDVIERGVNGKYSEKLAYDNAGRLWRTNSGDGAYKYFLYDNNGNQSLVVTSDGRNIDNKTIAQVLAIWGVSEDDANNNNIVDYADRVRTDFESDVTATLTRYDARNLAIEVREPEREYHDASGNQVVDDFITKRGYNAFGEVISETDALNNTINYTYNTMGRRIKVESPTVSITGTNGVKTNVRPTENYYYDISGRLVASRDANGNLTRQTLLSGTGYDGSEALITETIAADGGKVTTAYDIQGNARKVTDQINRVTTHSFDKLGRLIQTNHAGGLVNYYAYDGLGQQIKQYNNVYGSSNAQQTDYDAQGRLTRSRAIGGDVTSHSYVWTASATHNLSAHGGWQQNTTLANGKVSRSYKDVFGRVVKTTDLGGRDTSYIYDKGGRVVTVSGAGADTQNYTYLNTGKVGQLVVSGSNYSGNVFNVGNFTRTSTYGYDKTGNLTAEKLTEAVTVTHFGPYGENYGTTTTTKTLQNSTATYDALGRLKSWTESGSNINTTPPASKIFEYDAQGNIRRTKSTFRTLNSQGVATGSNSVTDSWYLFDNMNRVIRSEGEKVGSTIVRGDGTDIAYDKAGQRIYTVRDVVTNIPPTKYSPGYSYTNALRENYSYNAAGHLTQVRETTGTSSGGTIRSTFTYDLLGRQTRQLDRDTAGSTTYVADITKVYNAKSQITSETNIVRRGGKTYKTVNTNNYGTGTGYALGAAVTVTSASYENNSHQSTSRTTNTYAWYQGAVVSHTLYDSNISSSKDTKGNSYYQYSKDGTLIGANIVDGRSRSVTFTVDNNGQTIRRDEKDNKSGGDPHEIWYRFGGTEMGYVGNNGTLNLSHSGSISDRTATPSTGNSAGAFRHNRSVGQTHADFDQAYQAINSYSQGSQSGTYTVQGGETLQSIAQSTYGDSSLWYKIAQANGLSGDTALIQGQTLNMPTGVVKTTHNADTVKPYNAGEVQGDLSPTEAYPPKGKKKCGVLGQILLVVVAVAVTLATKGAGAKLAGAILGVGAKTTGAVIVGAGLAAAAGSVASQAVGVATGIQEKFSFKGVALAAISGSVGAGLGGVEIFDKLGTFGGGAARGALGSAISQGIGVATGLQGSFSFASVAAAGVGGGVGAYVDETIGANPLSGNSADHSLGNIAAVGFSGTASAIASAATRSAIEGSSFGDNIKAAIPDVVGQVLGGIVGDQFLNATFDQNAHNASLQQTYDNIDAVTGTNLDAFHGAVGEASNQILDEIIVTGQRRDKAILEWYHDNRYSQAPDNRTAEYNIDALLVNQQNQQNRQNQFELVVGEQLDSISHIAGFWDRVNEGSFAVQAREERYAAAAKAAALRAEQNRPITWDEAKFRVQSQGEIFAAVGLEFLEAGKALWNVGVVDTLEFAANFSSPTAIINTFAGNGADFSAIRFQGVDPALEKSAAIALLFTPSVAGKAGIFTQGGKLAARSIKGGVPLRSNFTKLTNAQRAKFDTIKAQTTGTPGHAFRSYREAIKLARDPNVVRIHLDNGYNRALNLPAKTISPNRRPDVTAVYNDGRVRRIEVQSRTDNPNVLRSRNNNLDSQLIAQGFTPLRTQVIKPTSR